MRRNSGLGGLILYAILLVLLLAEYRVVWSRSSIGVPGSRDIFAANGHLELYYPAERSETGILTIKAPLWGNADKPSQYWKPRGFYGIELARIEINYISGPREVLPDGNYPCELKDNYLVVNLPFERDGNEDLLYSIKMRVTDEYGFEHVFEHGKIDTIEHFELIEIPLKCSSSWFVWFEGDPIEIELSTHSFPPESSPDGDGVLTIAGHARPNTLPRRLQYFRINRGVLLKPSMAITAFKFSPVKGEKYSFIYQVEQSGKTYRFIAKQVEFKPIPLLYTISLTIFGLVIFALVVYFLWRVLTPIFDIGTPRLEFHEVSEVQSIRVRYSGILISKLKIYFTIEKELDTHIKISKDDSRVDFNEYYQAEKTKISLLGLFHVSKDLQFDVTCLAPVDVSRKYNLTIRFKWQTLWIRREDSSFWEVKLPIVKTVKTGIQLDVENASASVETQPAQPIQQVQTVQTPTPPPPEPVLPEEVTPEEALCATLNHWWSTDAKSRKNLRKMLYDVGLKDAVFYELRNLEKILTDITCRNFAFKPSPDEGSWLWYSEDNNNTALALPMFSERFSGLGLAVLMHMFSGLNKTSQQPIFKAISKACLLERIEGESNHYRLKEFGYLILKDTVKMSGPEVINSQLSNKLSPPIETNDNNINNIIIDKLKKNDEDLLNKYRTHDTELGKLKMIVEKQNELLRLFMKGDTLPQYLSNIVKDVSYLKSLVNDRSEPNASTQNSGKNIAKLPDETMMNMQKEMTTLRHEIESLKSKTDVTDQSIVTIEGKLSSVSQPGIVTVPEKSIKDLNWQRIMSDYPNDLPSEIISFHDGNLDQYRDSLEYLIKYLNLKIHRKENIKAEIVHIKVVDNSDDLIVNKSFNEVDFTGRRIVQLFVALTTAKGNEVALFLPAGKYYDTYFSRGYKRILDVSSVFTINNIIVPALLKRTLVNENQFKVEHLLEFV